MATKSHFKITPEIEEFLDSYEKAIESRTAAIFAGAGLSIPAGFVNWRELLRNIAKSVRLNIDIEHDLIAVAQYHVNEKESRDAINKTLVRHFTRKASITENHKILSRLPIHTFWTTNYDSLIESTLAAYGKNVDIKHNPKDLPLNIPMRDAIVYKMRGDISKPNQAVITKDDYESYSTRRQLFSTALQGDLVDKTFLFLGFSFSDPNVEYILSRIRILLGKNQRLHYCLMQKVKRKDFKSDQDFNYAQVKQKLQIRDLKRFKIHVILLEDYRDITILLKIIENRIKRRRIFISGSADDYSPYKESEARQFIHNLSKKLVKNGYEVVTGFGRGVGDAVINGALDHIFSTNRRRIDRYIILRPFPQFSTGKNSQAKRWTEYRKSIISESGICIFIFGNKKNGNSVTTLANGVREEFKIALENNLPIISVGSTGYVSKEIYEHIISKRNAYPWKTSRFVKLVKGLGSKPKSLKSLVPKVIETVDLIREESK